MTITRRDMLRCCLLALLAVSASSAQSRPVQSDQQILMQLERDWDAAIHRRDVKVIEPILADEFLATYGDGSRGDKAKELALAAAFDRQVDSSKLDEFTIKIYGDTAVVWFTQHMVGPSNGRPLEITNRYMDVFVMRDARWQCVASQSTRVTPAPK